MKSSIIAKGSQSAIEIPYNKRSRRTLSSAKVIIFLRVIFFCCLKNLLHLFNNGAFARFSSACKEIKEENELLKSFSILMQNENIFIE